MAQTTIEDLKEQDRCDILTQTDLTIEVKVMDQINEAVESLKNCQRVV